MKPSLITHYINGLTLSLRFKLVFVSLILIQVFTLVPIQLIRNIPMQMRVGLFLLFGALRLIVDRGGVREGIIVNTVDGCIKVTSRAN